MGTKSQSRVKITESPSKMICKKFDKRYRSLYLGPQLNQLTCISNDEWIQIIKCLDWDQVQSITLYKCNIDDDILWMISQLRLNQLKILRLDQTKITAKSIDLILNECNWPNLHTFILDNNNIRCQSLEKLIFMSNKFGMLHQISLNNCGIEQKQLKLLINEHRIMNTKNPCKNIKDLSIRDNDIGSTGIKILSKINWQHIQKLNVRNTKLNIQGIKHLSKANLTNLIYLNIQQNSINLTGYYFLINNYWNMLNHLQIGEKSKKAGAHNNYNNIIDGIAVLNLSVLNNNSNIHRGNVLIKWECPNLKFTSQLKKIFLNSMPQYSDNDNDDLL